MRQLKKMTNNKKINTKYSGMKALCLATFLSFSLFLLPSSGMSTEILQLKTKVEVHKNIVTLGDIFKNMTNYRSEPIFKSPALGRQGTVRLERLIEAAERYDFTFNTPLDLQKIIISRPARTIKVETYKTLILSQIKQQIEPQKDGELNLTFNTPLKKTMVPLSFSGDLKLKNFKYNKYNKTFSALLLPIEKRGFHYQKIISGKAIQALKRPIIKRAVKRGDRISASDIEMQSFTPRNIPKSALKNYLSIIGMTAKRSLGLGSFIRTTDIELTNIIKKNQLVTLIMEKPGISLKTQGKAMENAGLNETVAVMNLNSKRIVHGTVKGSGMIVIQPLNFRNNSQITAQLN